MTITRGRTVSNPFPWRRRPFLSVLAGLSDLKTAFDLRSSSVVANWRVRFEDFPQPTVSRPPLFDVVELLEWLVDKNESRRPTAHMTAEGWYRLVLKAFHDQAKVGSTRTTACALVLVHHLAVDEDVADCRRLWELLVEFIGSAPAHVQIGRAHV